MRVLNAMQLKNGAKAESGPTFSSLTQPTQFLPYSKKTDDWAAWNLDWLELQGIEFFTFKCKKTFKKL